MNRRELLKAAAFATAGGLLLGKGAQIAGDVPTVQASSILPNATYPATFSDTFNRANESPLNPRNWYSVGGVPPQNDCLEVANNECVSTVGIYSDGTASVVGATFPANQWCAFTLKRLDTFGAAFLYVRANSQNINPCYALWMTGPDRQNGSGRGNFTLYQINTAGDGVVHYWAQNTPFQFGEGTQYALAVNGTELLFLANGNVVFTGLLSASPVLLTSGTVGMQLAPLYCVPLLPSQVAVSNFYAGKID